MHFKLYKDKRGEFRWSLIADNGKSIADSGEGYRNREDCEAGIVLVQGSANAKVVADEE